MSNAERIRTALTKSSEPLDVSPKSAYEALTRAKVDDLEADLRELRGRVDTLLWGVIGAVVIGVVMQFIGG